jgi:hypothetical protein
MLPDRVWVSVRIRGTLIAFMNDPVLAIPFLVLSVAMMRALLVRAAILPPTCGSCGRRFERRDLGETVCSCGRR